MKITITRSTGRRGARGEGVEVATCPALRHRHSIRGWYADGCRCPSTVAAHERKLERKRLEDARLREAAGPPRQRGRRPGPAEREIDDCPADRHRHTVAGYREDGCRCPSTIKVVDRHREARRETARRFRRNKLARRRANPGIADFDLKKANRRDAEALVLGYRLGERVSIHTRGLAVLMMIRRNPRMTDREIAWQLTSGGQGRWITHPATGQREHQPVAERQVQRIVAALFIKTARSRRPLVRLHDTVDRSHRAA